MTPIIAELRSAARSLARQRLFVTVAVISLGLALALNTTMVALIDGVAHPYVPYPEPERIALPAFSGGDPQHWVSWEERFRAVRDGSSTYDAIAPYMWVDGLMETPVSAEYQSAIGIGPGFFDLAGVRPLLGRTLDPTAASGGDAQAVVISYRFWNRLFRGRPLEEGLKLRFGGVTYTVVGVMPRGVHFPNFPSGADLWLPANALPAAPGERKAGPFIALRLKRGATIEQTQTQLAVVARRLTSESGARRAYYVRVLRFAQQTDRSSAFPVSIMITVVMVLVIACANLGTLMLARGLAHRRETAIRIALGASRAIIVRQVLAECAVIALGGVVLGAVLTGWALTVVPHFVSPYVPSVGDIRPVPSWRVFGFVLAAVVATILLAGLAPALRAAATDPTEPMKEGSGTTTGRIRDRYNPLVVVEVALSTALLMASALFLIFVARLAAFEWQYAAKRIVTAEITTGRKQNLPDRAGVERFFDDLVARSARLPGAVAAATRRTDVVEGPTVFGEQGKSGLRWMNLRSFSVVSPDYLRTLGVPVLDGRDFEAADRSSATGVAIVDEAAARRLWPDMPTPVGRMIKLGKLESPGPWLRVVGVARSMEPGPRPDYLLPPEPMIYVVIGHDRVDRRQLLVRGDGAGGDRGRAALALTVQHDLAAAAPWLGATRVAPLLEQYEQVRTQSSFMASIFGAFGAFGLALCAVGLYAVLAYTVNRRLREFAVRIALGAARRDVARLVIRDAAVMALGGVGVGAFVALWLTRSISDVLSARGYADAFALVLAEAVIFAVAFVASLGPVGRATRADPMEILRAG